MENMKSTIKHINREISALMNFLADLLSIVPIKTMSQENVKRTEHGKNNAEIACSMGLFKGKYRI